MEPADLLRITRMLCHFKPPDARFCPVLAELALAAEPAVRPPYPLLIRASFATPCLTGPRGRLLSKAELALLTIFHSYFLCWKNVFESRTDQVQLISRTLTPGKHQPLVTRGVDVGRGQLTVGPKVSAKIHKYLRQFELIPICRRVTGMCRICPLGFPPRPQGQGGGVA